MEQPGRGYQGRGRQEDLMVSLKAEQAPSLHPLICPFLCTSTPLSTYPSSIHPLVLIHHPGSHLSTHPSVSVYLSIFYAAIHLLIYSPIHSFICLTLHPPLHLSSHPLSQTLSNHSSNNLCIHPSIHLPILLTKRVFIETSLLWELKAQR